MNRPNWIHLNDDFSMGGVTKAMGIFDHPDVAAVANSRVEEVSPKGRLAKRYDADVIITHCPPSWQSLPFILSLRLRNPHARLVHVEHSYCRNWEQRMVPNAKRFRLMLRLAYSLYDEVLAVSHGQRAWLLEIGAIRADKLFIHNPWSGSQGLEKLAAPSFQPDRPLRLVAIGRFAEAKGFDTLVAAMRLLPADRFTLELAGCGPQEAELREAALCMPNVRFAGKVDDVSQFYERCDVVLIPSRWESFGQVAAEARLAARPILVSHADGLPEQVGEAGIIADCSTAQSLADAIARMGKAPLADMSRAARASMKGAEQSRIKAWIALARRADAANPRQCTLPGKLALHMTGRVAA